MATSLVEEKQSTRTHYEVLGVAPTAKLDEIKAAHRSLALQCHPDKTNASRHASTSMGNVEHDVLLDVATEFQWVQMAWTCLRDETRRRVYDQELRHQHQKVTSRLQMASSVTLSEMSCELVSIEHDDDNDDNNDTPQDGELQNCYTYSCRCGDSFEVFQDELPEFVSSNNDQKMPSILLECQSCSLAVQVTVDIPLESTSSSS
eukprot:scaffold1889_cov33-Attheya_sp.AAC.1